MHQPLGGNMNNLKEHFEFSNTEAFLSAFGAISFVSGVLSKSTESLSYLDFDKPSLNILIGLILFFTAVYRSKSKIKLINSVQVLSFALAVKLIGQSFELSLVAIFSLIIIAVLQLIINKKKKEIS